MALTTEQVWKLFCCKLIPYIQKWVPDNQTARDIEQEVFIRIHEKIDTLKDDTKVVSWVLQITKNMVFDYLRKKESTVDGYMNDDVDETSVSDIVLNQSKRNLNEELVSGMKAIIEDMPLIYKEALLLVEFEGLSQVELAKKLNISVSGAKSRVQRGRQMIKNQLLNCCQYQFDKYGTVIGVKSSGCKNCN